MDAGILGLPRRTATCARILAVVSVVVALLAANVSCVPAIGEPPSYRVAVHDAEASGLRPYWLGPEFSVGADVFDGLEATFPHGLAGMPLSSVVISYFVQDDFRTSARLDVHTLRDTEFMRAEAILRRPVNVVVEEVRPFKVAERPAELIAISSIGRAAGLLAIIRVDDQVVVATVSPSYGRNGDQLNPLMDPDRVIAVLQGLRPYDE